MRGIWLRVLHALGVCNGPRQPTWSDDGPATARVCYFCGRVFELRPVHRKAA